MEGTVRASSTAATEEASAAVSAALALAGPQMGRCSPKDSPARKARYGVPERAGRTACARSSQVDSSGLSEYCGSSRYSPGQWAAAADLGEHRPQQQFRHQCVLRRRAELGGERSVQPQGVKRRGELGAEDGERDRAPVYIAGITDGLGRALRRRGLIRDGYAHGTFRENLLAF